VAAAVEVGTATSVRCRVRWAWTGVKPAVVLSTAQTDLPVQLEELGPAAAASTRT
jgi:hypothetical protein